MKKSPLKLLLSLLLAAFIVFLLGRYTPVGKLQVIPGFAFDSLAYLFSKFEAFNKLAGNVRQWRELSFRNDELTNENRDLLSRLARQDILEEENDFLKKALDIKQAVGGNVAYAHVFNANLGPEGYNVLLNKGSEDGLAKGDVVITEDKALVGIIEEVSSNSSRVLFVSDPQFKITAKVLGGATAGIARGAFREGMYLDLIAKEDEIKEGDLLISTGDDTFPAALVVGRVSHVEVNESQMFKKVRLSPEVEERYLGKVVVLRLNI